MPPKAAQAKAAPEKAVAAAAAAPSADAELLKECDKALATVVNNPAKGRKALETLLKERPCSLTYRAQSAMHLMMALMEENNEVKHLRAAVAAADEGAATAPDCVHLAVARARAQLRLADALADATSRARSAPDVAALRAAVAAEADAWDKAGDFLFPLLALGDKLTGELLLQEVLTLGVRTAKEYLAKLPTKLDQCVP